MVPPPAEPTAVLLDVDGTLVNSNDAHAHAWVAAFRDANVAVEFDAVRRCIGMGGDKLMPAVSRIEEDSPLGQKIFSRNSIVRRSCRALTASRVAAVASAFLTSGA